MATLFERIGGEAAVDAAVDLFYRKVLSDDRVNEFFECAGRCIKPLMFTGNGTANV